MFMCYPQHSLHYYNTTTRRILVITYVPVATPNLTYQLTAETQTKSLILRTLYDFM